jgi:hypothetical protein
VGGGVGRGGGLGRGGGGLHSIFPPTEESKNLGRGKNEHREGEERKGGYVSWNKNQLKSCCSLLIPDVGSANFYYSPLNANPLMF